VVDDRYLDNRGPLSSYYERLDKVDEDRMVERHIHPEVQEWMKHSPHLDGDLRRVMAWWSDHDQFYDTFLGDKKPPRIVSSEWAKENLFIRNFNENAEMSWVHTYEVNAAGEVLVENGAQKYLLLPRRALAHWDITDHISAAQDIGWFNPRAEPSNLGLIAHELGHHWSLGNWNFRQMAEFWDQTFRHPSVIKSFPVEPPDLLAAVHGDIGTMSGREFMGWVEDWMEERGVRRHLAQRVSGYGATKAEELFAELFIEVLTAPVPGDLAVLARTFFRSKGAV
jgi:hypothetical protein